MLEIQLYNTLSRRKERLQPIQPGAVGLYVCGPTVYDRAHIGNARPVIVFDVLTRLLRHAYGAENVRYVRNITDVDDKITARARETLKPGESLNAAVRRITEETTRWFHEDMAALGALEPDVEPRCTEHIAEMVAMIERLVGQGHAYAAEGHVLFAVKTDPGYGQLSRRSLDDMIAGARVEVAPYKRDPMDFVLWKPSSDEEPGWPSPWGRGRPGWHIECSAMSEKHLGQTFDIHGGGVDLVFPHHENERAQSLCAHPDSEFARIWMHNGFVGVEGEKMSKSLGNFITVHDLRETVPGEVIRLAMLTTHYRQPFDWTAKLAEEARAVLEKWRTILDEDYTLSEHLSGHEKPWAPPAEVLSALADDLNTPKALAELHKLHAKGDTYGLYAGGSILGLFSDRLGLWFEKTVIRGMSFSSNLRDRTDVQDQIYEIMCSWEILRKERNFADADMIRDRMSALGVKLTTSKNGPSADVSDTADIEGIGSFLKELPR